MRDKKVSIFKTIYKTDVPYIITLEKALNRIKNGASKDNIEKVRAGDKETKNKLPAVVFAGEFSERNKKGLVSHSGLMVLDFDKFPNKEKLKENFDTLTALPFVVAAFISPSGDGVKAVIRIPETTAVEHEKYYKAFQSEYDFEYLDRSGSDVARVCFESYDSNIYIDYEAEEFSPELVDEGFNVSERVSILPLTDEGRIINLIMNFKWAKSFVSGQRNNYILDLAGAFCEYGVLQSTATGFLSQYISEDFTESELNNTIRNAYNRRVANSKFFEDNNAISAIKRDLKRGKDFVMDRHRISEQTFTAISEDLVNEDFWRKSVTKSGDTKISIEPLKYKRFLEANGFKKYFPGEASKPSLVYINSNKVEETSAERIKDFVLNYLSEKNEFEVWNYVANFSNLFTDSHLSMLDTIDLMMLNDTKEKSFISYNNGILEVTKDEAKLVDYIDVDGYVWKRQIVDRNYTPSEDFDNDFKTFIGNVSGDDSTPVECVIGYLLSTYKNKMNNRAIILNDEVISDNPEGGTGKGLFMQGVKQMRRTAILDGKSFDDRKSFPYQTVSQDTNVLVFDDVKKNFNFESKFSLVTEGLTLERKNKDAIKLTVEESPKLVISTNYAIKGEGNSHNRRRHEIEFRQYYGHKITPFEEFNRQLFDDWQGEDWIKFDNYMVYCLQTYFRLGLVPQQAKNLKLRKLIAESSMEFYEFVSDSHNLPINKRIDKKELFNSFTSEFRDYEKSLTRKRFNIWVQKYSTFIGGEYNEGNSNGGRWLEITKENV